MAKKDKATEKADAKAEKAAEREYKYGVEDIAEELGIKPASVRVQLRNKGIEKAGKSYGWNSKSDLKDVIDQLKAGGEPKKADKAEKKSKPSKEDAKPAKGKAKPSKKSKPADEDEDDDD